MIRDLDRVHGTVAFNYYNRNFRGHRQTQLLPWGTLHHELWIRATTLTGQNSPRSSASNKFCYKFNKPQRCHVRNCPYPHVCGHYRKGHPLFRCFVRQNGNPSAQSVPTGNMNSQNSSTHDKNNHSFCYNSSKK